MAAVDRGPARDDRQHGFSDTGRSDEQHVGRVGQIAAACEFSYEFFIDAGLRTMPYAGGWRKETAFDLGL